MRRAAVAGAFYEGDKDRLEEQLRDCFSGIPREENENIIGAVVPHAGYLYSGSVAASVYAKLPPADIFVILGVNHQGIGSPIAVSKDTWATPLGDVEADEAFVDALPKRIIDVDETAHRYEHSIEVQLPFLQFLFDKTFRFVPIGIGLPDEDTAREIGEDLADTIAKTDKKVVMLASSDFTHYEPDRIAREKDEYVIEAIKGLDVAKFYKRVYERNVTACGVDPIAAMMHAAKKLGAKEGKVTKYATSGDIIGDRSSVVGYGGIIVV
ncbi:MAG: MEMO1 family protein [Methanosarcinales archaeon]|nr:MEMO1 family protein [Methanosarcinales archaeon]